MTRTTRSRFDHELGGKVEGCTILEKRIIIPPEPAEQRRGVYEYLLEVPPAAMKPASPTAKAMKSASSPPRAVKSASPRKPAPEPGSFTRSTPDERGVVVRRLPSR
jgi:hypothetical protein